MKKIIIAITLVGCFYKANAQNLQRNNFYDDQLASVPPPNWSYPFCSNEPWILIFEDDFDGTALNNELWEPIKGVPRDFTFNKQKAWHQPENVQVEDGLLKIISKREVKENMIFPISFNPYVTDTDDFNYTTGEIWSKNKFMFGKYEAKIRIPKGKGLWPAFWLYGDDRHGNEVDIFEYSNYVIPREQDMTVHYDYNEDGVVEQSHTSEEHDEDMSEDFHIYTLIYDKSYMKWYVDGMLVRTYYRYYNQLSLEPATCNFSPTQVYLINRLFPYPPMNVIFNTAIMNGGNAPDGSTSFPVEYELDWFRYYVSADYPQITYYDISENSLSDGIISGYAADSIKLNNLRVQEGAAVSLLARDFIELSTEFEVLSGAEFEAKIINSRTQNKLSYTDTTPDNDSLLNGIILQQNEISDLYVFPNPTTRDIIVQAPSDIISNGFVYVYTTSGSIVSKTPICSKETIIALPKGKGVYIIGVVNTFNNDVSSYRIIKK